MRGEDGKRPLAEPGNDRSALAEELDRLLDERDRLAIERGLLADERDRLADARDQLADQEQLALASAGDAEAVAPLLATLATLAKRQEASRLAGELVADRDHAPDERAEWGVEKREFVADHEEQQAAHREQLADHREALADQREQHLRDLAALSPAPDGSPFAGADKGDTTRRVTAKSARADAARARTRATAARDAVAGAGGARSLAAAFLEISATLVTSDTPEKAMAEVVRHAQQLLSGADAVSFSRQADGQVRTVAASNPLALRMDELQHAALEGPSAAALADLHIVLVDDLVADARWPTLRTKLAAEIDLEVRSVLATPVADRPEADEALGALNHYGVAAEAFDDEDAQTAILLSAHLGALLGLATSAAVARDEVQNLSKALASRDIIGQAKGILMERNRLTADQAFDILSTASQRLNRKLHQIADELALTGRIKI